MRRTWWWVLCGCVHSGEAVRSVPSAAPSPAREQQSRSDAGVVAPSSPPGSDVASVDGDCEQRVPGHRHAAPLLESMTFTISDEWDQRSNPVSWVRSSRGDAGTAGPETPTLPELPRRPDVASSMRAVGWRVRRCGDGWYAHIVGEVVFDGRGTVERATVYGPLASTPVGTCALEALRAATLPPFRRERFSVGYPFPLR